MLILLVLSGCAVTIKNHWLHPIVFLAPTFLALKLASLSELRMNQVNRLFGASVTLGMLVLSMSIAKPMTAGMRAEYSWLNMPYETFANRFLTNRAAPEVIFVEDMRTAWELEDSLPRCSDRFSGQSTFEL